MRISALSRHAGFALVAACATLLVWTGLRRDVPHPRIVQTEYGDKFEILSEGWEKGTNTGGEYAYRLTLAVPNDTDPDTLQKLKATAFQNYAGPRAAMFGFHHALIDAVDPNETSGLNFFGIRISVYASAGPGPLPVSNRELYVENNDGTWNQDGAEGPAMEYVSTSTLKSGARFGLASTVEDFPNATYIYDCLDCAGTNAPRQAFDQVSELFTEMVLPEADREGLRSLHVMIFLGPRKTLWQFPMSVTLRLAKRPDGRWWGPRVSPDGLIEFYDHKMAEYRDIGRRMRGENTK